MRKLKHQHNLLKALGFSVLELMVVVVLVAGLMAIVIPAISSLAGADVKNAVVHFAGLTREVYSRAAISGITHRINIDLDKQNYWVEVRENEAGNIAPDLGYEELIVELRKKSEKEAKKSAEYQYVPHYKAVEGELGEKKTLDKNLIIYGAWTEQMTEVARTGLVSIYFFAGGYTQSAFVSIAQKDDEADTAMYIALSPLTAAVSINLGEPNTNDLLEGQSQPEN
jgi:type II secretory pathway pseudopilin PulG